MDVAESSEVESRAQGSMPRPRTQKKSEPRPRTALPRTVSLEAKDTSASAFQKKSVHKNFSGDLQKKAKNKVFTKIFQALLKILAIQKLVLSSSRGQANFRGLEASRPRTSKCVFKDSTSVSRNV